MKSRTSGAWILFGDKLGRRLSRSAGIEQHVKALLKQVHYSDDLRMIDGVATARLALVVTAAEQPDVGEFAPQLLARLARLGLSLAIEIY